MATRRPRFGRLARMPITASLGAVALIAAACSGVAEERDNDTDDNRNEGIDGLATTSGSGGSGGSPTSSSSAGGGNVCEPGSQTSCYTGPPATEGIGNCIAGTQTCLPDGSGFGPCDGEVVPVTEVCATEGDDDCDGLANEDGPDCSCTPGSVNSCYSGPAGTAGVGICQSGTQECNADGTGYGPCGGQTLPGEELCETAADENCDGLTPPCPDAVVDLRADNNRDGVVSLTDPSEDANENSWNTSHGAIFLANIDDDQDSCPTSGSDSQLAACNDANDNVVNGNGDLADLARLRIAPWPDAGPGASAQVTVSNPGAAYVRLFKKSGSSFSAYTPGATISTAELAAGVELAIEAKDFVRNANQWDGFVNVTLTVNGGGVTGGTDTVRMRVAPVLFRHHLDPVDSYYVTNINSSASSAFRSDLAVAANAAGVGVIDIYDNDQWTQDFIETAYMSMPSPNGQHVIHVNFRSANYTGSLRSAGRVVFTGLRGPDVAGAVEYDPGHSDSMDTLNSFGNFETIPPFTHAGQSWPMGRVIRGSHQSFYPDTHFDAMVDAQGYQDIVYVDTSWLLVAHVDETLSFVKANTPRGWVMLANDATMAHDMLVAAQNAGHGSKQMFIGKYWSGGVPAAVSINQVLNDADVMNESAWAAVKIDEQINIVKAATGLTDAEIVPVPFLHQETSGYSVAYQPGTVNGIYLADDVFASPDPHGPVIAGEDIFKAQLEDELSDYGINVYWVENWDLYHRLLGEVHCGTNATRVVPNNVTWWN